MERLGFWGLLMGSVEKSSDSVNSVACSASTQNGDDESTSSKQVSPLKSSGSRNTSPLGRVGSRNTSPSRQKVVKTKPRGLEEETVASFGKPVVADVQMEDGIWAMLPEDLLNEILARVPPFMIFRIRSVCKKWNSILLDNSFLKFHSNVSSHGPCLLTFWKNSPHIPQCSVFSLSLKTWYKVPFTFLPPWAFWLVGSSLVPAKFPRSLLDGYLVAGTQKRLFLVGRIGLYSTLQSMRIWELDHTKVSWVEISRMPPKYFRALLRLSAERFECFGQDNLICFTSWNQGKGLLYNVDKKIWSWISGCALQSCNSQVCFYEPRFDASVH